MTYGPKVKALTGTLYREGFLSHDRIAACLNAAGNGERNLSEGSVYRFCRVFSEKAQESLTHREEELLNQPVVSTDATVITVTGEQNYIRNFSVPRTVIYYAMKKKTIRAMNKLRLLRKYTGILMPDHEVARYHFGTDHEECNVHIIRYLKKNTEDTGNPWSGRMVSLLCRMNRERKALIGQGAGVKAIGLAGRLNCYHRLVGTESRTDGGIFVKTVGKVQKRRMKCNEKWLGL